MKNIQIYLHYQDENTQWEVQQKGYAYAYVLVENKSLYEVSIDAFSSLEFAFKNRNPNEYFLWNAVVVVPEVTNSEIKKAIEFLYKNNGFLELTPLREKSIEEVEKNLQKNFPEAKLYQV